MSKRIAVIFGGAALAALTAMPTYAQLPPPPPLPGHWSYQHLAQGDDYRQWREEGHHDQDREREQHRP
jgi:hypothetical protein